MIRQAISCDICGAEKKQTNHWFVAYEQSGELRVSGWSSRNRLRPGSKHLCGQTCLHKLADDFMARAIAVRTQRAVPDEALEETQALEADTVEARTAEARTVETHAQKTPAAARPIAGEVLEEAESSARLLTPPPAILPKPALQAQPGLVAVPLMLQDPQVTLAEEPSRFASRTWRAEAWARERERALFAVQRHRSQA